ncbi:hypothetical protein V8C35DRAFT_317764 [Trichoderma chlorosporum]
MRVVVCLLLLRAVQTLRVGRYLQRPSYGASFAQPFAAGRTASFALRITHCAYQAIKPVSACEWLGLGRDAAASSDLGAGKPHSEACMYMYGACRQNKEEEDGQRTCQGYTSSRE